MKRIAPLYKLNQKVAGYNAVMFNSIAKTFFITTMLMLLCMTASAKDIKPLFRLQSQGAVTDFVIDGLELYASNDIGTVDVFDLGSRKKIAEIVLEPLYDHVGEPIAPRILSVDRRNGKTVIVSTGNNGYRNVWMHDGQRLEQIIGPKDKLCIKEARFIDDERLMFGTLAYEMMLYDLSDGYSAYKHQIAQGAFSDVVLSEDRTKMIAADESGEVTLMDVEQAKVLHVLASENVDNVYKVAYSKGTVITAGQDRRVGVYLQEGRSYHLKSDFLVYCVGLSPSGKIGVYSSGEESDLQVFNTRTAQESHRLVGHDRIVTNISFINENELFSSGDEPYIFFWKLD